MTLSGMFRRAAYHSSIDLNPFKDKDKRSHGNTDDFI